MKNRPLHARDMQRPALVTRIAIAVGRENNARIRLQRIGRNQAVFQLVLQIGFRILVNKCQVQRR